MDGAKQKNNYPLQNSWSQVLLLIVIIITGLSGLLLPIPSGNQLVMLGAAIIAIISSFFYYRLSSAHNKIDLELIFDIIFGLAIFIAIFASQQYGIWYLYALFMLSISDAIIYRYRQLLLILILFSSELFLYYSIYQGILTDGSGWLIIINIIALWATAHFVWFYAKESEKNIIENLSAKHQLKQLTILEERRSEFLHIAAHQLKNPLGITRFILLNFRKDKNFSGQKQKQLTQATFQIETALKFLDDTTRILNMESTLKDINRENIEIEILIKEIVTELEQLAKEKNLHIIKHIGGIIPTIVSDRMYLKIAITNIIDNAIKYSKKNSRIIITITELKDNVQITVQDYGIGICRADQGRIYERFFRGAQAKDYSPKGTGLGLYLVLMIINKINGKISFESTINKGSIFTILIPINQ